MGGVKVSPTNLYQTHFCQAWELSTVKIRYAATLIISKEIQFACVCVCFFWFRRATRALIDNPINMQYILGGEQKKKHPVREDYVWERMGWHGSGWGLLNLQQQVS